MKVSRVEPEITQSSINGEAPSTNLNTTTLGFTLGPRLNAASRMGHANIAFSLLTTQDQKKAEELALTLNQKNTERQKVTAIIFKEYMADIEDFDSEIFFQGRPSWSVGLLGLVASKIREKYYRPVIAYTEIGNIIHASCRTIPEFDLMEMIKKAKHLMDDAGGHKASAGFRAQKENLDEIKSIFKEFALEKLKDQELVPVLKIDTELFLNDIGWPNYDQIQKFDPFGKNNLEPRFLIKGLEINDLRTVGKNDKHLKMNLICFDGDRARNLKGIGFNLGEKEGGLKKGDSIDVVFEFILNQWNGTRELELKIIDIKLSKL